MSVIFRLSPNLTALIANGSGRLRLRRIEEEASRFGAGRMSNPQQVIYSDPVPVNTGGSASDPALDRSLIIPTNWVARGLINELWWLARSGERPKGATPSAREPTAGGSASRGEAGEA